MIKIFELHLYKLFIILHNKKNIYKKNKESEEN